jgi:hypothetical protein
LPSDGTEPPELAIGVEVGDPRELWSLREHLRRLPGIRVVQLPGRPGPGELGAADTLQIISVAVGPALAIAIKTLPEFVRSRRSDVKITLRRRDREIQIDVTNEADVQALIDKLLGDA